MRTTTTRIESATAALDPETREQWRAKLWGLQHACGCREGALAMTSATMVAAIYFAFLDGSSSGAGIPLTIAGVAFGSATVGKATGLLVARARLRALLRDLERGRSPLLRSSRSSKA